MRKRLTAMILSIAMVFSLLAFPAGAAESDSNELSYEDFTDLDDSTSWYYEGVSYVIEEGIMNGTGGTLFSPDGTCTRSMIVTILYRLAGSPTVTGSSGFSDVEDGQWYTDAIIWAEKNEITTGTGNGTFNVSGTLTREQFATFMYRFAEYMSYDTSAREDLNAFPDSADVDDWAEEAMSWAVAAELITGSVKNGVTVLAPTDSCTRSMAAVIIYRFDDVFADAEADDAAQNGGTGSDASDQDEDTGSDASNDAEKDTDADASGDTEENSGSDSSGGAEGDTGAENSEDQSSGDQEESEEGSTDVEGSEEDEDSGEDTEEVTVLDSGTCGDDLTYVLYSDGLLEISGTGDMDDYTDDSVAPWYDYRTSVTEVVIGDGVTSIGNFAFLYCRSLENITIPDSVTSIGIYAFYNCDSMESITIPGSVTSISNSTFYSCDSLESVILSDGLTSIGSNAFRSCTSLTSITIPDSVTSIGSGAFHDCSCLSSITIPDNVTSIEDYTFEGCSSLESVTIGDGVTQIASSAFYGCTNLKNITVSSGNKKYSDKNGVLFSYDGSEIIRYPAGKSDTSYTIPDGVTSIESYAFYNCDNLESITIPDSVTSIGNYAFYSCDSLESITISDSVTSIGNYAFGKCDSLESITIPDSVTSIVSYAFWDCDSLERITIPDSVTSIGDYAFYSCDSLESITIPDSVTLIGKYAFEFCENLESIILPDSLSGIWEGTFYECSGLTSITIPDSVVYIDSYAFYRCSSLTDVYYSGTEAEWEIVSIASKNSYLTSATIHYESNEEDSNEEKEKVAAGDTGDYLVWVLYSDGLLEIKGTGEMDDWGLQYDMSLDTSVIYTPWLEYASEITEVVIDEGVTSIGNYAFYGCSSVTSITIPDSVTSIGYEAFYGCGSLTDVYYSGTEEEWDAISVSSNNSYLTNAAIHYNSTGPEE